MLNDNSPLMFIDTVTNINESKKMQKTFDSRKKTHSEKREEDIPRPNNIENKPTDNEKFQFIENRKLGNIIEMYKKGRPVLCSLIVGEEEIIGIPSQRIDNFLVVNISENEEKKIDLGDIEEINIIKF